MSQDGVKVGSHLYSAFLKTCAAAGTPQLLDLGMAVHHDLYCHWQTLYSGSTVSKAEQECVPTPRPSYRLVVVMTSRILWLWHGFRVPFHLHWFWHCHVDVVI